MKKGIVLAVLFVLSTFTLRADACVGRMLSIGVLETGGEQVLAEMLSVLINERTGTTVNVRHYRDAKELYDAVKKAEVGIFVENTDHTMEMLGRNKEADAKRAYDISKEEFRKKFSLVVLEPMGFLTVREGRAAYFAPVITVSVLENFPALPRVINKLSGAVNDEVFGKLVKASKSGDKPGKAARDFLKAKKLI